LSRPGFCAFLIFLFAACSRQPPAAPVQRIAILRFENLSADSSVDWMGRAFAEILADELDGAPGIYAIPSNRLQSAESVLGPRPVSAPGISARREEAFASGANLLGYGDYWLRGGAVEARLTIEDPRTGRMTRVLSTSAAAGDVIQAASALAHQFTPHAGAYGTNNGGAVRAYVMALESQGQEIPRNLESAIAADPGFGAPYRQLADWKVQQKDIPGAIALLGQALSRSELSNLERARVEWEASTLRGDQAGRARAIDALSRLLPNDAPVWRARGESALTRHKSAEAVESFQQALRVEPEDTGALNLLAYAFADGGNLASAEAALHRYQTLRPEDPNPLDSLGDVNLIAGRLHEAEALYLQAADKNRDFLSGGDFFKAAMARLMTGDVPEADKFEQRYLDGRTAVQDPLVPFRKAEWLWVSGRRRVAIQSLESFAQTIETGPLRETASRAYAEAAIWSVVLGRRDDAMQLVRRAESLAGPSSAQVAAIARFLAQPPAPAAEWTARALLLPPTPFHDLALACALFISKDYQASAEVLQRISENPSPTGDEWAPILLAASDLETGRATEAAALVRSYPVPLPGGVSLFAPFFFPRFFYLRGRVAEQQNKMEEARANYRVFLQLSGPDPLIWGEENRAAHPSAP
jgi:Flp pilus assembly protein TadD